MTNLDASVESWAQNKLNSYYSSIDEYEAYCEWCDSESLDPDDPDAEALWEKELEARAEDAAVARYESRMEDALYDARRI